MEKFIKLKFSKLWIVYENEKAVAFFALKNLCKASHKSFKWIKQHLQIKRFWGESENAVRIQINVAIMTYCLIAIIEHDLKIGRTVVEVMRILCKSALNMDSIRDLLKPLK